jgi:hypothetical protein
MHKTPVTQTLNTLRVTCWPLPGLLDSATGSGGLNDPLLAPEPPAQTPLDGHMQAVAELGKQAIDYLGLLGLTPVEQPQMAVSDLRYVAGPLIVFDAFWGQDVPDWLRGTIRAARLGLVLAGERELASEEESLAYLMTAGLAQPLTHDWARTYLWLGSRVLMRWQKMAGHEDLNRWLADEHLGWPLTASQEEDLRRLRWWLRRRAATAGPGAKRYGQAATAADGLR